MTARPIDFHVFAVLTGIMNVQTAAARSARPEYGICVLCGKLQQFSFQVGRIASSYGAR